MPTAARASPDLSDTTVQRGDDALFATSVSGSAPIVCEWTLDGTPIGTAEPTVIVNSSGMSAGPHTVQVVVGPTWRRALINSPPEPPMMIKAPPRFPTRST